MTTQQRFFRKLYSVAEAYWILVLALRTMRPLRRSRKTRQLSGAFSERIMLAVTEVNGCIACSYAHTKLALAQGMSATDIQLILSGDTTTVPAEEAVALAFAQHYADTRGSPTRESWQRVVETYGAPKANGILGAVRMIMVGNALGLPLSALLERLKGRRVEKSSVAYELVMLLAPVVYAPIAVIHALVSATRRAPLIEFGPSNEPSSHQQQASVGHRQAER